ncbi:PLP-dependent transferase [Cystobasidium minutum MCA 4210]|uniref:PLP-dependent transferase n=1 Tax=Cystobasidium minutum MCA 4210 TaxID=1397322 RepID=UPI0034CEDA2D|eukprot:jgi/Rhomi1/146259/e_gw1.6.66.1
MTISISNGHANGHSNGHDGPYKQSDEQVWKKVNKSLMNIGVPVTPILIRRAEGVSMFDSNGREILDFTSGQMSSILGHSHPEICQVVADQVGRLDHLLSTFISEPVADLADLLTSLMPDPLDKTFFLNTGSETTEAAIKLAKCASGKFEVIGFAASYHGLTGAAGAATYSAARKGGGPVMPGQLVFPTPNALRSPFRKADGSYDWEAEMSFGWDLIDRQTVGQLAAFIVEPILSTGGVLDLPVGYLKRLHGECKRRGMYLIVDEAQTGCGRTGDLWAFQRDGIVPDFVVLSKTLGAGLPLGAVVTTSEIAEAARQAGFLWLTTHLNDPATAAIGVKVLEIVVREDLTARAKHLGGLLRQGLLDLQEKHQAIADVRGRGLLQGIEITAPPGIELDGTKLGALVAHKAMDLGLSCNIVNLDGFAGVFRIAPPLVITEQELQRGLDILDDAFGQVLQGLKKTNQEKVANGVHTPVNLD